MIDHYYNHFVQGYPYPRKLRSFQSSVIGGVHLIAGEKKLIDFCSNDYLGLARHPFLLEKSIEYTQKWGVGSSSSRLIRGNSVLYDSLEKKIALSFGKENALILGNG